MRSSSGRAARVAALAIGIALISLAGWLPAHGDAASDRIRATFGDGAADAFRSLRTAGIGFDALLSVVPLTLGGLLAALALGPPRSRGVVAEVRTAPGAGGPRQWTWVRVWLATSILSTALIAARMTSEKGNWLFPVWIAAMAAGAAAFRGLDAIRGTPIGNPFRSAREAILLTAFTALALAYYAHDLGHWRWGGTPDESHFFMAARSIARGTYGRFVFSEVGVFSYHPVLCSWYQAVFVWLFGENAFAWKLSSAAAVAAALPFAYLLVRETCGVRAGWVAILIFGSAPLAVGFAHYGYNNAQVFVPICAALALFAWADRRRSVLAHFLAGAAAGFGFYTYFTARLVVPFLAILVWGRGGLRRLWRDRPALVALLMGLAITVFPSLFELRRTIPQMLRLTGATENRLVRIDRLREALPPPLDADRLRRFGARWVATVFFGAFSEETHHQTKPLSDPITNGAMVTGLLGGLLAPLHRRREAFAPMFLGATLVLALAPYTYPALTRVLLLVPLVSILAAVAIDAFAARLEDGGWPRLATLLVVGLVGATVVWNLATVRSNLQGRWHHGYGEGKNSEIVRLAAKWPDVARALYLVKKGSYLSFNASMVFAPYGLEERITIASEWRDDLLGANPRPYVVLHASFDKEEVEGIERAIAEKFPGARWQDSDPGEKWNVRYALLPNPT